MFVDASALTAMMAAEDDAEGLIARLSQSPVRCTSAVAIWETTVALSRILSLPIPLLQGKVDAYLQLMDIVIVPIGDRTASIALSAFNRYGKGRHRAALNMGDCFAYACAREHALPLLYKGEDFPLTDIEAA